MQFVNDTPQSEETVAPHYTISYQFVCDESFWLAVAACKIRYTISTLLPRILAFQFLWHDRIYARRM